MSIVNYDQERFHLIKCYRDSQQVKIRFHTTNRENHVDTGQNIIQFSFIHNQCSVFLIINVHCIVLKYIVSVEERFHSYATQEVLRMLQQLPDPSWLRFYMMYVECGVFSVPLPHLSRSVTPEIFCFTYCEQVELSRWFHVFVYIMSFVHLSVGLLISCGGEGLGQIQNEHIIVQKQLLTISRPFPKEIRFCPE